MRYLNPDDVSDYLRGYTLVTENKIRTAFVEGLNGYCEDDTNAKLIDPLHEINAGDTDKAFVIIRSPHPRINNIQLVVVEEKTPTERQKDSLAKVLEERFVRFGKLLSDGRDSSVYSLDRSSINFYEYRDSKNNIHTLVSASWTSKYGELACCIAGLYEVMFEGNDVILKDIINLSKGTGIFSFHIDKIVFLNDMVFMFTTQSGWEWHHYEIYEYLHSEDSWKSTQRSRGVGDDGGCMSNLSN